MAAAAQNRPVTVVIETDLGGVIEAEIDTVRAPITGANFLKYVDASRFDGGRFHRTVKPNNQRDNKVKIEVIQAGVRPDKAKDEFPPIKLERTRDILAEISARRSPDQLVVGFAAETDHLVENAAAKLRSKRLDLIVANDVTQEGAGFEVDTNIVTLVFPDGRQKQLPLMAKLDVADRILDEIVELRKARQLAVRS